MNTQITARNVTENRRMAFLPNKLPQYFLLCEQMIYDVAGGLIEGYTGGYWEFIELSNGGFYMQPSLGRGSVRVNNEGNQYSGEVSEDAAGIIATLFGLYYLAIETESDAIYRIYGLLKDFAYSHKEGAQIVAAID